MESGVLTLTPTRIENDLLLAPTESRARESNRRLPVALSRLSQSHRVLLSIHH
jgi:hypothetical protein